MCSVVFGGWLVDLNKVWQLRLTFVSSHCVLTTSNNNKKQTWFVLQAVNAARSVCGFSSKIEVECRSIEEGREAAGAGVDIVMLDNFQPQVGGKRTKAQVISHLRCLFFAHLSLHKLIHLSSNLSVTYRSSTLQLVHWRWSSQLYW